MHLFPLSIRLSERGEARLLELIARALDAQASLCTAINGKLDNLAQQITEIRKGQIIMATQVERLQESINALGVAIDAEILEIKAALDKLGADNPALEAAIASIAAQAEKVHGIIVAAPVVESVTG